MIVTFKKIIQTALTWWIRLTITFPKTILLIFSSITLFLGFYSAKHLGVITDTSVMLSDKLGYLKVYRQFKKQFPHSYNRIVILIEGATPDIAIDARDTLANALKRQKQLFPWVYVPGGDEFFKKNGLLFLTVEELEDLLDRLSMAQPILSTLVEDTSLHGFFSMLEMAMKSKGNDESAEDFDLSPIYSELYRVFYNLNRNEFYQMSWLRLMTPENSQTANDIQLIIVQPKVDYKTVLPGQQAIHTIKNLSKELKLVPENGVRVLLTGDIPMEFDELRSVTQGAKMAGILSIIMVILALMAGLGAMRLVFATLVPLVAGLVWTASFAAFAIGHLNMISVAFAVLFIGLGVDYAIHLNLKYRELVQEGIPAKQAILQAAREIGPSLALCALTTSIGFYSFMPTDFSGVAELGLISGTGMFIALFANLTLIPAILILFPLPKGHNRPYYLTSESNVLILRFLAIPYRHGKGIRIVSLMLTIFFLFCAKYVRFDSNPINLRNPNSESIIAFKKLLSQPHGSPWSLEAVAQDDKELEIKQKEFERLSSVRHAISIDSFIPKEQDEKLAIIEDMDFILGPILQNAIHVKTGPLSREIHSIEAFVSALRDTTITTTAPQSISRKLLDQISIFLKKTRKYGETEQKMRIKRLTKMLLASFPKRMKALGESLNAGPVTPKNIPADLRKLWIGIDGSRRIKIVPKENPRNDQEIIAFINQARMVDQNVTGYPVLIIEGGKAVTRAFTQAFTYSIAAIFLLLLILMPQRTDAFVILYSLLFASAATACIMVIFNIPLNFANIIALPLILGIGVDNGIHIVHRHRLALDKPVTLLRTSTARGIFFSTLTTTCSFGNLAVSPHLGMASMGKLLATGVTMTLISAIIVIPSFLSRRQ